MHSLNKVLSIGFGFAMIAPLGCTSEPKPTCTDHPELCIPANFNVTTTKLCKSQDWKLNVEFGASLDLGQSVGLVLRQQNVGGDLQIVATQTAPSKYAATVNTAMLSSFQRGMANLSVKNEPSFGSKPVQIGGAYKLQQIAMPYTVPGKVSTDGQYPTPEKVALFSNSKNIAILQRGQNFSSALAWQINLLRYNGGKLQLGFVGSFYSSFSPKYLATMATVQGHDAVAEQILVTDENSPAMSTALQCKLDATPSGGCIQMCDPATDKGLASLLAHDLADLVVGPMRHIAYADLAGTLYSTTLPDPMAGTLRWAAPTSPPAGARTSRIALALGNLTTASSPSLLAAYQDASALQIAAYKFNASGGLDLDASTASALTAAIGTMPLKAMAVGDMDGNGLDDFVFVRSQKLNVVLNQSSNWCSDYEVDLSSSGLADINSIAVGEISGDSSQDIVLSSGSDQKVSAYINGPL